MKIVVLEITIDKIEGTLKMGQNGTKADRESSADALSKLGNDEATATSFLIRNCDKPNPISEWKIENSKMTKQRANERWFYWFSFIYEY